MFRLGFCTLFGAPYTHNTNLAPLPPPRKQWTPSRWRTALSAHFPGSSSQAQVQRTAARRGDRLITSSACRWMMGPGRRSVQPDHRRKLRSGAMGWKLRSFPLMAPLMPPEQEPNCRWRGFDFPGGGFDFPGAASISQTGVSSACIFLLSKNLKCSFS